MILDKDLQPEEIMDTQIIFKILKDHTITADLVCGCGFDYNNHLPNDFGMTDEAWIILNGEEYSQSNRNAEIYNTVYLTHQAEEIAKYFHSDS